MNEKLLQELEKGRQILKSVGLKYDDAQLREINFSTVSEGYSRDDVDEMVIHLAYRYRIWAVLALNERLDTVYNLEFYPENFLHPGEGNCYNVEEVNDFVIRIREDFTALQNYVNNLKEALMGLPKIHKK